MNIPDVVTGSVFALPHMIPNDAMRVQFARSGWGSVWLSMYCGTPIVVPDYDENDDPEVFFNNAVVEKLGIGIVYRGQALAEILGQTDEIRTKQARIRDDIAERWGTLNGNDVCAKIFVQAYVASQ